MRRKKKKHDSESSDEEFEYEDDEYAATCQGCDMSFASVAGLDAHRQRCNKKVRYGTNKLKGEGEVEGNNNFKQGVCEDGEPPFAEVNASLLSARSEVQVNKKLGVAGPNTVHYVQFVKYDVTVSFMAQVLDTVTYLVPQVLDTAS